MDQYKDMDEVMESYLAFISKVPFYGLSVLCLDNPNVQHLIPKIKNSFITYGRSSQADIQAMDIKQRNGYTSFCVQYKGENLGTLHLPMPGVHNVLNSLAAVAVSMELEIDFKVIKEALEEFSGVERRFELKAMAGDVMVVDDYGHHPVEIKATLKAAKEGWGRKITVVFQPHRYSRTRDLYKDFLSAFYDADSLIMTDIYAAGEKEIEGIDSEGLCDGIRDSGHKDVIYIPARQAVVEHLLKTLQSRDMVITMGAGDIWKVGDDLIGELKDHEEGKFASDRSSS